MFYDNFKAACERKGTTITAVLADIGRASGNTGGWKMGKFPRLDIVMEIAEHLQISIDELVYGLGQAPYSGQTQNCELSSEWRYHLSDTRGSPTALQGFSTYSYGFYSKEIR